MKHFGITTFLLIISLFSYGQISRDWTSFAQAYEIQSETIKKFKVVASVKVESDDEKARAGVWARVDNKPGQGRGFFDNMRNRPIRSDEWKEYTVEGTFDENAESIIFGGIIYNNGKFLFDKFELYIADENGTYQQVEIENQGFESGISNDEIQGWFWGISDNNPVIVKEFSSQPSDDSADGKYALLITGENIKEAGSLGEAYPNIGKLIAVVYLVIIALSFLTFVSSPDADRWSGIAKIGFRFAFIYFLLFIAFLNNGAYPFWRNIFSIPMAWMQSSVLWFANDICGIPFRIAVGTNGSGDTSFSYLLSFFIFILAVSGSVIWSVVDRKRPNYQKLYYWLTTAMRYYVGLMLINYGLSKVIQLQFPEPTFNRLLEAYGDSSPMGLAWTFLGFSEGYNMFMGIAEVLAGLLLFRRSMTAGAIITVMTTMNVMAVNYFFDVPVKITSTHLVLISLFLLSKDLRKIVLFLLSSIPVKSVTPIKRPQFNKVINIGMLVLKILIIGYAFGYGTYNISNLQKTYGSGAPKPPLYGLYKVTNFVINGDTITSYKNEKLWKDIRFQRSGSAIVTNRNEQNLYYRIEVDTTNQKIKFTPSSNTSSFDLHYTETDKTFDFNFIHQSDTVSAQTLKLGKEDFLLTNRGFHWISEYPFNR
ncbi:MAG: hypothetical protein AAFQ94_12425 [Bacteroidota bacterium]